MITENDQSAQEKKVPSRDTSEFDFGVRCFFREVGVHGHTHTGASLQRLGVESTKDLPQGRCEPLAQSQKGVDADEGTIWFS